MENNTIMSMKTKTQDYLKHTFISLIIGVPLICMGIWIFYLLFIDQIYKPDVPAVSVIGVVLLYIGIDGCQIAIGNYIKYAKSKNTILEVTQEEICGKINNKEFLIKNEDLVSVSIQTCSVECDSDGVPKNMNPGIFMKLYAQTNKYLCLFTNTGKAYYIDCLTAPEMAKNTLDALIAKYIAGRKDTV